MTTPGSTPPNDIDWQNLINAGRDLLNPQMAVAPPTGEHIRRAISNAYYALFHAPAGSNADDQAAHVAHFTAAVYTLSPYFRAGNPGPPSVNTASERIAVVGASNMHQPRSRPE